MVDSSKGTVRVGGHDGISEGMIFKLRSEGQMRPSYLEEEKSRPREHMQNLQDKKIMRQRTPLVSLVNNLLSPPARLSALTQFQTHLQLLASLLRHMNTKYNLKGVFMPSRQPLIWGGGGKSWQTNAPGWHHLAVQRDTLCAVQISAE